MTNTTTRALEHLPTTSLPQLAAAALARLESAFRPAVTVLMSFPTRVGATVEVQVVDGVRRWTCTAGHDGNHAYASLPFCRDDAKAHAETCRGASVDVAKFAKVLAVLGLPSTWRPRAYLGETETYLSVWSQMELNDLFLRVGGTVTTRQVERSTSDGDATWTAIEITLTVQVPGVGPVEVVTDIEDDPEHGYRTDVPVVAVARYEIASRHCRVLAAASDFDGCLAAQDEMRMCRCQLAAAGRLDLLGVA
jgi:hypothetical protein